MTWIIIALILLFILGSITWIMPSPEDRRRMKLRNQALKRGFRVKELKGQLHQQMVQENGEGRWYIYMREWPHDLSSRAQKMPTLWLPREGRVDTNHPVGAELSREAGLPVGPFDVIYADAQGLGGIWSERGKPEELEQGLERLRQVMDRLAQAS